MFASVFRAASRGRLLFCRPISGLAMNSNIKAIPNPAVPNSYFLSYLDSEPPNARLAIGTTTSIPPTPQTFSENPNFISILYEVLTENAHNDGDLIAQAKAFAGPGGATLGSGGAFFPQKSISRASKASSPKMSGGGGAGGTGAGGANAQGGAGGAGRGGYVHLSDSRNIPDFGRIAWPEDILGSVEVDGEGNIIGKLQPSGTYRILTIEGILGLSPFLREKLVERLRQEERKG